MELGKGCVCIDPSIRLHLEGALEHYIKEIREDITRFVASAVEFKERNPVLSQHYLTLVESQKKFVDELEKTKGVIKILPVCDTD